MTVSFLPVEGDEACVRERFHRLVNARENPQALAESRQWILRLLAEMPTEPNLEFLTKPSVPPADESQAEASLIKPELVNGVLLAFHAPLALLEGGWLQSLALAANNAQAPVNHLFACYLTLLGDDEADSPAFAYRGWLHRCAISLPSPLAWQFAQEPRIGAPALDFASVQLALGMHASRLIPEALGFTFAYLRSASPWRLSAVPEPERSTRLAAMNTHVETALQVLSADAKAWPRVAQGFSLFQHHEAHYLNGLSAFAQQRLTLAGQVAAIFRRKLSFARGYHAGVELGGRDLEAWFAETPFDASSFLSAFASSQYAKGKTGRRWFDRLVQFGGPMFGVFDQEEMQLIDAWLDQASASLTAEAAIPVETDWASKTMPEFHQATLGKSVNPTASPWLKQDGWNFCFIPSRFRAIDNRRLFNRLINQDSSADTLSIAKRRVEQVLRSTQPIGRGKAKLNRRFFEYTPEGFAQWIVQIHAQEVAKHKPFQVPPTLRKEEYLWLIRQFAPVILVDGCWLQHMGEAANQDRRVQRLLFRTYAEELGEGRIEWNHPKIYLDLLQGLGIDLPAVETVEFSRSSGLLDSVFDLPSYLLAISQFPRTYLPEILGLNLAIELSGLGGGYMQLAEELRYWNINPLIVTLHLSIDNLANGHAAMAAEAIQNYMDGLLTYGEAELRGQLWKRIWVGFLSLNAATRRLKWALVMTKFKQSMPFPKSWSDL